jgi:hypothetical protein
MLGEGRHPALVSQQGEARFRRGTTRKTRFISNKDSPLSLTDALNLTRPSLGWGSCSDSSPSATTPLTPTACTRGFRICAFPTPRINVLSKNKSLHTRAPRHRAFRAHRSQYQNRKGTTTFVYPLRSSFIFLFPTALPSIE